ncbi:hypothetical protein BDY21DRAFT_354194 [Lineolata rhizophorae]|uniref:Uncharacterized protein n=1 Tax=Lineolata rhizophorae TaxID=578093 RepID=A0A6A6NQS8_9PEZI|nr:hypothetical protein BDY21DRAFT_354194 [Lineolata rhizophorae]
MRFFFCIENTPTQKCRKVENTSRRKVKNRPRPRPRPVVTDRTDVRKETSPTNETKETVQQARNAPRQPEPRQNKRTQASSQPSRTVPYERKIENPINIPNRPQSSPPLPANRLPLSSHPLGN